MEPGSEQMYSPHENLINSLQNVLVNEEFDTLGKEYVLYCMQRELECDRNGNESFGNWKEDENLSKFKNKSKLKSCLHYTTQVIFLGIIALISVVAVYGIEWTRNDIFDVPYFVQRLSRSTLLPFHGLLKDFYFSDCLIHNPYYINFEDSMGCDVCSNVTQVEDYTGFINASNFEQEMEGNEQVFILKEKFPFRVGFDDLKQMFRDNEKILTTEHHQLITNHNIKDLDHLFEEYSSDNIEKTHKDLNVGWITRKVRSAQVIRRIFTRPYFVPKRYEVGLQKNIFIDGPEGPGYPLPMSDFASNWYVQAYGSRVLLFEPSRECIGACVQISVTVNERDIVYWSDVVYTARSLPSSDRSRHSISFSASFI